MEFIWFYWTIDTVSYAHVSIEILQKLANEVKSKLIKPVWQDYKKFKCLTAVASRAGNLKVDTIQGSLMSQGF